MDDENKTEIPKVEETKEEPVHETAEPTVVETKEVSEPKSDKKETYAKKHTTIAIERDLVDWLKSQKSDGEKNMSDVLRKIKKAYEEN